jgi:hypothetical protein
MRLTRPGALEIDGCARKACSKRSANSKVVISIFSRPQDLKDFLLFVADTVKIPEIEVGVICNRLHFLLKIIDRFTAACQYIELSKSKINAPELISALLDNASIVGRTCR